MAIFKLKLDFVNDTDSGLSIFSSGVASSINGNIHYPLTNPTVAAINVLITNFNNSLIALPNGGQAAKLARDQARLALEMGLRTLANDLESKSGNDPVKMATTGFQVIDSTVRTYTQSGRPTDLTLEYGTLSGQVNASVKKVPKTAVYLWRYTADPFGPNARWSEIILSTSRKITISGLERGIDLWVQCGTFNSQGYSDWSDPATIYVR